MSTGDKREDLGMILCAGEALIDMLPRESTAGEAAFAPYPGGAVFNTAIALGRLGAPAAFFSGLSTDFFGNLLTEALQSSQVETDYVHRSDRPTTLAIVRLEDGQASYMFYDENTAGRMLDPADLPMLGADVTTLFFGGISLVVDPCAAAYETLAHREASQRTIMVDPNIRPSFIVDETAYRDRIARMIGLSDIVKLSDEDLHWLLGDSDISDIAKGLLGRGPKLVCVTKGAEGVTGYTARGEVSVTAPSVQVADTVGAGDTFNAGLLAGLARAGAVTKDQVADLSEETLQSALRLGVEAAAVTVSRAGANPPWVHELG